MQTRIIYLVDDDKIYQFASSRLLARYNANIEVKCFDDGEQAIVYMENNRENVSALPDVILLDINMPVLDGWGFLDRYKNLSNGLKKHTDIYIVSSSIDNRDMAKTESYSEVKKYLVKPLSEEDYKMVVGAN